MKAERQLTVKKLREWAGDLVKVTGNKWKHTTFFIPKKTKLLMALVKVPHRRKNLKK
jgi:hypothetical protein